MIDAPFAEKSTCWEHTTLGEICNRGGGEIRTGPFGSQLHSADYVAEGVPSVMPTNIGDNRIIEEGIARITEADANRLSQHRLRAGDIIYSRRGDVEKRALIREREVGWVCGTGCLKVRLGKGVVDPLFASYWLGHPNTKEWIVRHAVGATMPNLNTSIMSAVPFVVPPLAEQKRIARVLGTLDDKIELNRRMNATLEAIAQALFQSWFVNFDPVRRNAKGGEFRPEDSQFPDSFENAELGAVPAGWRAVTLGEVSKNTSVSFDFKRTPEVVFVNTGDVLEGDFLHSNRTSHIGLPGQAKKSIRPDDILFSEIRPANKRYAYVDFDSSDYVVSTKFMIIRASEEIHPRLLYRILTANETLAEFQLQAESRSGTFPQITFDSISHLPFVLPPMAIQDAFQRVVECIDARIKLNKQESKILANLRDTLLPKLLSGDVKIQPRTI